MRSRPAPGLSRRAFLGTAAALAASGRASAQQANDAPASLRRTGSRTTLQFRAWERYPASDIPGLNRYLDRTPALSIEWVSAPFGRYRDRMITEFVGNVPLDIVQVPETELASWADSGWLEQIDGRPGLAELMAAALPVSVEGVKAADGKTYALPFLAEAFGFAYDKEALNRGGFERPARTLDELRAQMVAIKRAGIDDFPLSLAMKRLPGQFWSLWATLYASGGSMFDAENEPVFDGRDPRLKAILEWYVAAVNDWRIVGAEDLQRDWGIARTAMRAGGVKFGYMAQYALAEFNIWPGSQVAGRIRMALVPGLEHNDVGTVGYNHSVGLAKSSRSKDAAWAALTYYAGKDQDGSFAMPRARLLAEGGRCPYLAVYADPEVQRMTQQMTGGDLDDYRKLSEIVKQRQAMKAPWYPEWELYMMQQVQDALVKNVTVTDALNASAREARRLKRT